METTSNTPSIESKCASATIRAPWRSMILTTILACISACGGGGSGSTNATGSTGTTNPPATLSVSPTAVSVTAALNQPAPTANVQVSVQTNGAGPFYLNVSVTSQGVASASGSGGVITVQFKSPSVLAASPGAGAYSDTLTVEGCYDQACTQQMTNSPIKVPITFMVTQAAPTVFTLSPSSVTAGASTFTLTVSGSLFLSSSQVFWNGSARATTYISSSQLTAQISATDVANAGIANVQVATSGIPSTAVTFSIAPLAALSFSQVSPRQVTAGGSKFYVTAIGNGFTGSSAITWNGTSLATTYVSSTVLRGLVTADLIANTGSASITVVNPPAQGGSSSSQTVTIAALSLDATAFQMNPAHTGAVNFQNLALPSGSTWSVDVGGTPSYALIVGGKVFVTVGNIDDGASQLLALDGASGTTLWGPIAFSGLVNVAYDGGKLFVVSGQNLTQVISGLDPATGNSLWSATVPGEWSPEVPVAAYGVVYTTNGGIVTAFDESSGVTLWSRGINGTNGVVAVTADGVYDAAPCTATNVQPAIGIVLWNFTSGCSGGGGATPVVANGLMYSPDSSTGASGNVLDAESGTVEGTYSADVTPAFTSTTGFFLSNRTLRALALGNNQILWSFAGDGQLSSAPIVVSNYVFIGSASGNLYALDATTGAQVWSQNLGAAIPSSTEYAFVVYTGLAAGDGLLVVPNGTKVTAYLLSNSP